MTLLSFSQMIFGLIIVIAVFNSAWVVYLVLLLRRKSPLPDHDTFGKAVVLLCLRGADPRLSICLDRLMSQDHPNFEVRVVVDSRKDPAWPIVQAAIERHGGERLRAWPLKQRLRTCGLKNSSLVQLLDQLDASFEAIALADADLESHPTWLRELVAPLADPSIGLTFGNRWFLPDKRNTGSLVRQVWNAPGLIVMSAFKIPWAGSMAFKASLLRCGNVREKLAASIVDDGPLRVIAREQKLRTVFVPSLIMPNREECGLPFAYHFIRRQLTWTRTYFSHLWFPMIAYHFLATSVSAVAQVVVVIGLVQGDRWSSFIGLCGFVVSMLAAIWQYAVIDQCARRSICSRGESGGNLTWGEWFQLPLNLSLAALIGLYASVVATLARRIVWRGVTYEIRGRWRVRLVDEDTGRSTKAASSHGENAVAADVATNLSL